MSERGAFRGRGGGGGGRGGDRGGRGGGRGGHGGGQAGQTERPKKENILDLGKYMDKELSVKFSGGREGTEIFASVIVYKLTIYSHWHLEGLRPADESCAR